MFCPNCGQKNEEDSQFCSQCGKPLSFSSKVVDATNTIAESHDQSRPLYAGFWKRFAAFVIDNLVLLIPSLIVGAILGLLMAFIFSPSSTQIVGNLVGFLMTWLYYSLMESSGKQATLGKMAVGIKVVDLRGEQISFARATGRFFAKIISAITFMIGYLMAGMTRRKQALHDMVAGCLVINNDQARGMPTWAVVIVAFFSLLIPVGILAAIAIPAYQDYTVRAKVGMVIADSSEAKTAVTNFIVEHQQIPATLEQAGSKSAPSDKVKEIALNSQTGAITITMNFPPLVGKTLIFNPALDQEKNIVWSCASNDIPAKYLPAGCRR